MFKKLMILGAAVAIFAAMNANAADFYGTLAKIKETGTIVLGHRESSVPFAYIGPEGKPIGYSMDLCMNAVEAIQGSGTITVQTHMCPDRDCVRVEIADTGCGIAPEDMARIFEPFFSTKSKGTGLGLAVSYGIVQNHQGTIRATSQPGQGTSFTVELPTLLESEAQKAKEQSAAHRNHSH